MTIKIQNEKGVTLIELLVVAAIIIIVSALAFVGPAFLSSDKITGYTRELLGDLQRAREDAMIRSVAANSRGFGVRFLINPAPPSNPQYVIFEFDDCNGDYNYDSDGCAGDREEANTTTRDLSTNYELLVDGAVPNNDVIIYDYLGIPRAADWGMGIVGFRIRQDPSKYDAGDIVTEKCISVSLNRIREGVWDAGDGECDEQ